MQGFLTRFPFQNWRLFTKPLSADKDRAFREQTIRTTSMVLTIVLAFALALQLLFFSLPETVISYDTMIAVALVISGIAVITVRRGNLLTAGLAMTFSLLSVGINLVLITGIGGSDTIPTILLSIIIAAMVLNRRLLFPITVGTLIIVGIIISIQGRFIPRPAEVVAPNGTIFASAAFVLIMATLYLRQLRIEFDNRLAEKDVAKKDAERANKVKGQFLANISHELRTPMNAIIGYGDIMLGGMTGPLADKQIEFLGHIKTNSIRLLELINDVLDLSRIEAGENDLKIEPMTPRKTLTDLVNNVRSLATNKDIELTVIFEEATPETVLTDSHKFAQIFTNLLSNGLKFTSKGGVYVRSGACTETDWFFEVRDTGIGIPEADQQRIFEAFQQVDSSDTRQHTGTGLGLAITKQHIEKMGGSIAVHSTPGQGSSFTVTIPRKIVVL